MKIATSTEHGLVGQVSRLAARARFFGALCLRSPGSPGSSKRRVIWLAGAASCILLILLLLGGGGALGGTGLLGGGGPVGDFSFWMSPEGRREAPPQLEVSLRGIGAGRPRMDYLLSFSADTLRSLCSLGGGGRGRLKAASNDGLIWYELQVSCSPCCLGRALQRPCAWLQTLMMPSPWPLLHHAAHEQRQHGMPQTPAGQAAADCRQVCEQRGWQQGGGICAGK